MTNRAYKNLAVKYLEKTGLYHSNTQFKKRINLL
uniref:Uncharacterized protein n=1 Tax=Arundo donax TaxID=35708 RepID=A0A0A9GPQ2_ARUDO